jgi:hypothetical protein
MKIMIINDSRAMNPSDSKGDFEAFRRMLHHKITKDSLRSKRHILSCN